MPFRLLDEEVVQLLERALAIQLQLRVVQALLPDYLALFVRGWGLVRCGMIWRSWS